MELTPQLQQIAIFIGVAIGMAIVTIRSRQNDKPAYAEKQVAASTNGNGNGIALRFAATAQEQQADDIRELRQDMQRVKEDFTSIRSSQIEREKSFRLEIYREVGKIVTDRMKLELHDVTAALAANAARIEALERKIAA